MGAELGDDRGEEAAAREDAVLDVLQEPVGERRQPREAVRAAWAGATTTSSKMRPAVSTVAS